MSDLSSSFYESILDHYNKGEEIDPVLKVALSLPEESFKDLVVFKDSLFEKLETLGRFDDWEKDHKDIKETHGEIFSSIFEAINKFNSENEVTGVKEEKDVKVGKKVEKGESQITLSNKKLCGVTVNGRTGKRICEKSAYNKSLIGFIDDNFNVGYLCCSHKSLIDKRGVPNSSQIERFLDM